MDKPHSILIVDDEESIRHVLRLLLADYGFRVLEAANGREALAVVEQERLALVLTDLRMPEMDGLALITALVRNHPELPVIVISGVGVVHEAIEAVRLGAWDYLSKPLHDQDAVLLVIERALERARLMAENRRYRESLEELVRERTAQLETANRELKEEVAERKRMEQDILKLNAELTATLQTIPDLLFELDQNGIYLNVWAQNPTLLAAHREQLLGHSVNEVLSPEAAETVMAALHEADVAGASYGKTIRIDLPAGQKKWFELSITSNKCSNGIDTHFMLLSRDITERKRSEEQLELMNFALDHIEEAAFLINEQGEFKYVNEGACLMLGYSRAELLALSVADLDPDWPAEAWCGFWQELQKIKSHTIEGRHRTRDGRIFPVEINANYFEFVGHGYNLGLVRDISERKQMEQSLRESEQQFLSLAENLPDNIARYDRNCRRVYVNPQLEKTLGRSADSLLGLTPLEDNGETFHNYQSTLELVLASGQEAELDQAMADAEKGIRCHDIRFVAERDAGGSITGVMVIGRDITERVEMEVTLRKSRHLLAEAQRIAHLGSWELELATNCLTWSDEILRMFEMERFGATYGDFLNLIHPDDREMVDQTYRESILNRTPYKIEHRLLFHDGRIKHVQERCETYYSDDGTPLRSLGTVQDITERKLAEEMLLTKQRKLAELELELSFAEERERQRIAAVLHDHIGQLLLLARIKLGTLLSGEQSAATGQTISNVRALMDEAIQSTRSLTIQLCPPVLGTMGLEPALELLCRQMREEWELQVEFSDDQLPKPLPPEVRTVVYQTARELLINVGKHASTNRAQLAVGRENSTFLLMVSDNGAGFDPELLAVSRQAKSFGIFNSMRRIRNLGGEMTMDSAPLNGTRVTIRMPFLIEEECI